MSVFLCVTTTTTTRQQSSQILNCPFAFMLRTKNIARFLVPATVAARKCQKYSRIFFRGGGGGGRDGCVRAAAGRVFVLVCLCSLLGAAACIFRVFHACVKMHACVCVRARSHLSRTLICVCFVHTTQQHDIYADVPRTQNTHNTRSRLGLIERARTQAACARESDFGRTAWKNIFSVVRAGGGG